LEILKLRKLKFKEDKQKFDEAEKDYEQYNQQFEKEKEKKQFELTDEEKKELKTKFRKATFLCHPDKVNDEFKEAAQKIFIELRAAYEANDLKKVTEILNDLEKGNYFKTKSETIAEKDKLKVEVAKLKGKIRTLEEEIIAIKGSETFMKIIDINDWDEYFNRTKEKLQLELEELKFGV
jgi:curved DNA-binding protein CbpA